MIKEKHLTVLCISILFLGILIMFSVSLLNPDVVSIRDIDETMVGEFVSLEGTVNSVRYSKNNIFFNLHQGSHIMKAVVFNKKLDLENGQEVKLKGEIALYKGELEIIVENIE